MSIRRRSPGALEGSEVWGKCGHNVEGTRIGHLTYVLVPLPPIPTRIHTSCCSLARACIGRALRVFMARAASGALPSNRPSSTLSASSEKNCTMPA